MKSKGRVLLEKLKVCSASEEIKNNHGNGRFIIIFKIALCDTRIH